MNRLTAKMAGEKKDLEATTAFCIHPSCPWDGRALGQENPKCYGLNPLYLSLGAEFANKGQSLLFSRQPWDGHCQSFLWPLSLSSALWPTSFWLTHSYFRFPRHTKWATVQDSQSLSYFSFLDDPAYLSFSPWLQNESQWLNYFPHFPGTQPHSSTLSTCQHPLFISCSSCLILPKVFPPRSHWPSWDLTFITPFFWSWLILPQVPWLPLMTWWILNCYHLPRALSLSYPLASTEWPSQIKIPSIMKPFLTTLPPSEFYSLHRFQSSHLVILTFKIDFIFRAVLSSLLN